MRDDFLASNEGARPPETGDRAKTLGILGGMGPLATAHFYGRFVAATNAVRDQDHHRVVILSEPKVPDRSEYLLGRGPSPVPALVDGAISLKESGADLMVIPCNTAATFRDEVASVAEVEIFDWVGAAVDVAAASTDGPIGLLATEGTVESEIYQLAMAGKACEVIVPSSDTQELITASIYGPSGVKATSRATEEAKAALGQAIDNIQKAGAQALLVGCTELPILLDAMGTTSISQTFDPGKIAISALLDWFDAPEPARPQPHLLGSK